MFKPNEHKDFLAMYRLQSDGEYQDPHFFVRDLRVIAAPVHATFKGGYKEWLPVRDAVEKLLRY